MRAFIAWILPALVTFAAWWMFLGTDQNDVYTVPQVAGLVVALIVIGVACGWFARRADLLPMVVSAVMGVAAACWTSWSDDESGLFVVGWLMVVVGTAVAATLLIVVTWSARQRNAARERGTAE